MGDLRQMRGGARAATSPHGVLIPHPHEQRYLKESGQRIIGSKDGELQGPAQRPNMSPQRTGELCDLDYREMEEAAE